MVVITYKDGSVTETSVGKILSLTKKTALEVTSIRFTEGCLLMIRPAIDALNIYSEIIYVPSTTSNNHTWTGLTANLLFSWLILMSGVKI